MDHWFGRWFWLDGELATQVLGHWWLYRNHQWVCLTPFTGE